jgi:hypothetical protein
LVDIDPTRDPFVNVTDAEKGHARAMAERVRAFLRQRGWHEPILGDSGNGFHLLYRLDLPAEDDRLVERVLTALAKWFDTAEANIDVANLVRAVPGPPAPAARCSGRGRGRLVGPRLPPRRVARRLPFAGDASRTHALAALVLPFVRDLADGPTPLHLFDAPVEGTGKPLLANVSVVATGRVAEPVAEAADEWHKRITAVLASALTSTRVKDRLLGVSKTAKLPNTALRLASGNNMRLSRELIRRTVFCRIDARVDVPWEREEFRHPDLVPGARRTRPRLVQAVLTLCGGWVAAGRKPGSGRMGMFEGRVGTIGGILEHACRTSWPTRRRSGPQRADLADVRAGVVGAVRPAGRWGGRVVPSGGAGATARCRAG